MNRNGWALSGLMKTLEMQGKKKEAQDIKTRLEKSWQHADVKLKDGIVI
jgi:hypothetical protein